MKQFIIIILISFTVSLYAQQVVLPGDYPDPSVVKIGQSYWATATTSNWSPIFPLLESKNLIDWQAKGFVFTEPPSWADYYFWAPEISYENNKVYVYYSAHKRGGNLCLAVASADNPEGPYTDHGPLVCQDVGSIDAFPMRETDGKLYMIWKEDGNSVGKPTPIWAAPMKEDRSAILVDEKVELFRNDQEWEANLVEGVAMIRHREFFYAIYAGAGCCGRECTYAVGVARAKSLLGPWEKYDKNPLIKTDGEWKCPGHGTAIEHNGKFYFLYHAYDTDAGVYSGRQGVLSEFIFTDDHWIEFKDELASNPKIPAVLVDEFNGKALSSLWQHSIFHTLNYKLSGGRLNLTALPTNAGTLLGQKTYTNNYEAEVEVLPQDQVESGIAIIGDDENIIGAVISRGSIILQKIEKGKITELERLPVSKSKNVTLKVVVEKGKDITFSYKQGNSDFTSINNQPVNGHFLPPWDRAVRVGLISRGEKGMNSTFEKFTLRNKKQ